MKNILIVDDDQSFLLSLADMFKSHSDKYSVVTAFNGKEAIEALTSNKIDLVVTDLKMPELDGFGLLAYMSSRYAEIPVIVMTAFSSPETSDRLDIFGIFQCIEKPVDFDQLEQKIQTAFKSGSKGHIAGVSLGSFLQLLGLDSKTCTLKITSGDEVGILYFQQGELFEAFAGEVRGLDAALDIVGWDPVEIDIEDYCRKDKRVIEEPLGFILIEGARRSDEKSEKEEEEAAESVAEEADDEEIVTDIEFNASAPPPDIDITEEAAVLTGGAPPPQIDNEAFEMLVTSVESLDGFHKLVITRRDGELLINKNAEDSFSAFVCKTALEASGTGAALNLDEPQYISLAIERDQRLLILFGEDIILGLEIKSEIAPAALKANIDPILKRVKFD